MDSQTVFTLVGEGVQMLEDAEIALGRISEKYLLL